MYVEIAKIVLERAVSAEKERASHLETIEKLQKANAKLEADKLFWLNSSQTWQFKLAKLRGDYDSPKKAVK